MNKDFEIYVHIPFCERKCLYCDFLSFSSDDAAKKEYVDALLKEIELLDEKEGSVRSVFIGGGTPSTVDPDYIRCILDRLRDKYSFKDECEITCECNPGTLSKDKLKVYKDAGINRISLGLQSCNDDELKALGRIHDFAGFLESFRNCREMGFANINVDLMSALPNQSEESFYDSLHKVAKLGPEHISVYSLILEEKTPLYAMAEKGILNLPDEDTERRMYEQSAVILKEYGYERYEISNYAKKGRECLHNIGYWDGTDYIGIGLGASSYLDGVRLKNISTFKDYISFYLKGETGGIQRFEENIVLTDKDKMEEYMMLGLRMTEGVDKSGFKERFGIDFSDVYEEVTRDFVSKGLVIDDGKRVRLSRWGLNLCNQVLIGYIF